MSNYPERTKTKYQPRGIATLVTMAKINTVCNSGTDKYDQWSFVMLKGKHKWKLAGTHAGCNNVVLYKKGITTPDPCKQFMKDFEVFLEEHLNKNKELIL
eukprot:12735796-Ditylum_brightwellii.AAC.1